MSEICKIVVVYEDPDTKRREQKMEQFVRYESLSSNIENICVSFKKDEPSKFGLKFFGQKNDCYVTEENRFDIDNGHYLQLVKSAAVEMDDIVNMLGIGTLVEKQRVIKQLAQLSTDPGLVPQFLSSPVPSILVQYVSTGKCGGECLQNALKSINNMCLCPLFDFKIFDEKFISRLIGFIRNYSTNAVILENVISILANTTTSNSSVSGIVQSNVTFNDLLVFLSNHNSLAVLYQVIKLLNALFMKGSSHDKLNFSMDFQYHKNHFHRIVQDNKDTEDENFAKELNRLQTNYFYNLKNFIYDKPVTIPQIKKVFDNLSVLVYNKVDRNFYKIFNFDSDDLVGVFNKAPSKLLLKCFAHLNKEDIILFSKFNANASVDNQIPFGPASINLVEILCEIYNIEQNEIYIDSINFCPLIFSTDFVFEQMFCISIGVFFQTWREVKAKTEDLKIVSKIVKQKIALALNRKPSNLNDFKKCLKKVNYQEIRANRRSYIDLRKSRPSVIDLKNRKFDEEVNDLIKQNRFLYMQKGTVFPVYKKNVREEKSRCIRLSKDQKKIVYGETFNAQEILDEEYLKNCIDIKNITQVLVDSECPHFCNNIRLIQERQFSDPQSLANSKTFWFSIGYDTENGTQSLDFIAFNPFDYCCWIDGRNFFWLN